MEESRLDLAVEASRLFAEWSFVHEAEALLEEQSRVLEDVSRRVEERLNAGLIEQASHIIREHPRVIVGHARVLNNSMIRPERLVARLVAECREGAVLERQRAAQANKSLLQELILGDALTPVYQPIVHLKSGDTFGYEALIRGPRGSPLEAPTTLFSVRPAMATATRPTSSGRETNTVPGITTCPPARGTRPRAMTPVLPTTVTSSAPGFGVSEVLSTSMTREVGVLEQPAATTVPMSRVPRARRIEAAVSFAPPWVSRRPGPWGASCVALPLATSMIQMCALLLVGSARSYVPD